MKNITKLFLGLVLSLFLVAQAQAQSYTSPSQESVEVLLRNINKCKEVMDNTQQKIKTMQANPDDYSLADYQDAQGLMERARACLHQNRNKLDALRKEYPGWFNSPSATIPIKGGKTISSKGLKKNLDAIERKIKALLDGMEQLEKPEH